MSVAQHYAIFGRISEGLAEFRKQKGYWPKSFGELFDSGLMNRSYRYMKSTAGGAVVKAFATVERGDARITPVRLDLESSTYRMVILGYDMGELGAVNPPYKDTYGLHQNGKP